MNSRAEEFRAKALEADLEAERIQDPGAKAQLRELARGWRMLAEHVEWLNRGTGTSPLDD